MTEQRMNKDYFINGEQVRAVFNGMKKRKLMHTHEFWEMSYVYEGNGTNYTQDGEAPVKDGELLLISPGKAHSMITVQGASPVRVCNCLFTADYAYEVIQRYLKISDLNEYSVYNMLKRKEAFCLHITDDNARNVQHLMWLIAHEYNHFTAGSDVIIRNTLLDLFVIITRLYEYQTNKTTSTVSRNAEIDELMKYMRTNFSSRLTLEMLADRVHLSREYLSRYFKQYTGKTISEFLTEIRMTRAKQMLTSSSVPIADIAVYCGYPSVSNFQKAFKKYTGVSPSAYRKG